MNLLHMAKNMEMNEKENKKIINLKFDICQIMDLTLTMHSEIRLKVIWHLPLNIKQSFLP